MLYIADSKKLIGISLQKSSGDRISLKDRFETIIRPDYYLVAKEEYTNVKNGITQKLGVIESLHPVGYSDSNNLPLYHHTISVAACYVTLHILAEALYGFKTDQDLSKFASSEYAMESLEANLNFSTIIGEQILRDSFPDAKLFMGLVPELLTLDGVVSEISLNEVPEEFKGIINLGQNNAKMLRLIKRLPEGMLEE